jgi:AraC-like DNA-binding protein
MKYFTVPPPPRLAPYVRCFWVFEGEASDAEPYIYRGYADGCTELVFHYQNPFDIILPDESTTPGFSAGIHAQTRTFSRNIVYRNFGIFGCYLYPYAIPRLFGFPANDLTDQMTDFGSVVGRSGDELAERMLTAADNASRVAILSVFLVARLDANKRELPPVFSSINEIITMRGLVDVKDLASDHCLSNRQFERKVKEFSGFSPKLYSRIIRFQTALKYYGSERSLTDIAYDCGYYDQSHFISDFKEFSGYSPKAYFSGAAEGSEYLDV